MTEFLGLIEDCVIKVLSYCELETLVAVSQTCKRLKLIVERFYFPKFTEYTSDDASPRSADKSIIKNIGKHLRKLSVTFNNKPLVNTNNYCVFLAQTVGANIRELEIISDGLNIPPLESLAPILNQLHILKLSFQRQAEDAEDVYWPNNKTYTVDLALLCHNLQELTFTGLNRFPSNCTTFRRLESLTVCTLCQDKGEIDLFLDKNPQIRQICFLYVDGATQYIDFNNFTENFVNLEKLDISMKLIQNWSFSPQMFVRLQNLKILRLKDIRNSFNDILESLRQLKQLKSISLYLASRWDGITTIICQQTLVQLAKELDNLQSFSIRQPSAEEVAWNCETVLDFVRHGSKLNAVYFQRFNFEYTSKFIRDLVDARKFSNPNGEPLEIGTDDNIFYPVMKESGVEVERYLKYEPVYSFGFP